MFWFTAAAVTTIAFVAGLTAVPEVRSQVKGSVSRQPSPFTDLYFTDPASLPKHADASNRNMFRFTISDHENRSEDYVYVVTEESVVENAAIDQGTLQVGAGQSVTTSVQFASISPNGSALANTRYQITVRLLGRSEIIHFSGSWR